MHGVKVATLHCITSSLPPPPTGLFPDDHNSMPSKTLTPDTQTDRVVRAAPSIFAYATAVAKGDAPWTTLIQQQDIEARVAARDTRVQHEVDDAVSKLKQEPDKYVLFLFLQNELKTCL
ncbi:hypothetical protein M434DRAFT_27965 [Hypoxylon sp. CO27-5]|nr:hypothetical protein M434DRAFT_27965 [Hypoxylon sp. CO27-5]